MKNAVQQAKAKGADLAIFGEAFLHGFDGLQFNYKNDIKIASSSGSEELAEISCLARTNKIAIGFGYYENDKGGIYSSYLVFDENGNRRCNYRRVSEGWRIRETCADYREGKEFVSFKLKNKKLGILVCGDFWEDHLLPQIITLDETVDAFIWPVHCDYEPQHWETGEKQTYAERSQILAKPVLFCNNFCEEKNRAKGGAYCWHQGKTIAELPPGTQGILIIEI